MSIQVVPHHSLTPIPPFSPIRTKQTSSTLYCDYMLSSEGKILIRSLIANPPKTFDRGSLVFTSYAQSWHHLDGLGVPYDENKNSLLKSDAHTAEYISEFMVACGNMIAVSNLNRIFMYKITQVKRPICWEVLLGSPRFAKKEIYLPKNRRDWTFSCSISEMSKVKIRLPHFQDALIGLIERSVADRKLDDIHPNEVVSYFFDGYGIPHDFGHTSTIYVLLADGQRIVYWDTGLAPSFSRGFLVPDGYQGQSISAAGSIIFLSAIDANNQLHFFTRLLDYETCGGCPGLGVTYTEAPEIVPDPGETVPTGFAKRKFPLRGWVKHMLGEIAPYVTHEISIHLIGKGDAARELRIQGVHPTQGSGYYFKNIADMTWKFCPAVLPVTPHYLYPFQFNLPSLLKNYVCLSASQSLYGCTIELKNFHHFLSASEPCELRLSHANSTIAFKIHVVDGWGFSNHKFGHEDLIGTIDGEPKAVLGTLMCEQLITSTYPQFNKCVLEYFLPYHAQVNALRLMADNQKVILSFDKGVELIFNRTVPESEIDLSFYVQKVLRASLADASSILQEIKKIYAEHDADNHHAARMSLEISVVRPVLSRYFKIMPGHDPRAPTALADMRKVLKMHRRVVCSRSEPLGYHKAIRLLCER